MKIRNLTGLFLPVLALIIAGCGGGGGGGGGSAASVSGTASKGLITGGHFQAFQILSSHNPAKSKRADSSYFSGVTGADGSFGFPLPAGAGRDGVLVIMTDGDYLDEATQQVKHVELEYPGGMRAAFGNMSGVIKRGEHATGNITPFTEMAVRLAGTALDDDAVKTANTKIGHAFGLDAQGIDIVRTQPLDPAAAPPAGTAAARKAYTKALEILSGYQKDSGAGKTLNLISSDLLAEVQNPVNNGAISAATATKFVTAELNIDNSGVNKTGLASPAVPTITASASKLQATSNGADAVTITATVQLSGVPLAGAQVKFAVKSGAGTLSASSIPTDQNGIASVTLTSTLDGDADIVTATVGGTISADTSSIAFVNPSRPTSIVLSANPSSGTTLAGGGVTLTAVVSPLQVSGSIPTGTAVSFTITSGNGTLSAITTTGNGNGTATATLSSGTANDVTVRAAVGSVQSTPITVSFRNQPTLATVKLSTTSASGLLPAGVTIGGINATLNYSAGKGLNPNNPVVSGVATTSTLVANFNDPNFPNQVILGLFDSTIISTDPVTHVNVRGVANLGEFATATFAIAPGNPFPTAADFTLAAGSSVLDFINTAQIPGVTVTISVTIQ